MILLPYDTSMRSGAGTVRTHFCEEWAYFGNFQDILKENLFLNTRENSGMGQF